MIKPKEPVETLLDELVYDAITLRGVGLKRKVDKLGGLVNSLPPEKRELLKELTSEHTQNDYLRWVFGK